MVITTHMHVPRTVDDSMVEWHTLSLQMDVGGLCIYEHGCSQLVLGTCDAVLIFDTWGISEM